MSTRVGAVIVAAEMSKRMEQFEQIMKEGSLTFAERVVLNFRSAGVRDIVMVTGYQADRLEKSLGHLGIVFLRNEEYEGANMLDSARLGLRYLMDRTDRVFFCPVDVPFFLEETVRLEMEREESIVFPTCRNQVGYPILFSSSLISAILDYQGSGGLKEALDSLGLQKICYLPVNDEGAVMDTDTKEHIRYLMDLHNSTLMRAETKVFLSNVRTFCGPGTVTLLKQVDSLGSVSEACAKTGISYSKAWKLIRNAERELGFPVVSRMAGGRNGGESQVTEEGRRMIELYEILEKRVSEAAQKEFCELFLKSELFSKSRRRKKSDAAERKI